jgi:branched-subunit amino acid aminotransferase/4-amino-4-deoxychorismate lyase
MKEVVFLNGKFVSVNEAKVPILDPGFLPGYGVFETMRSYHHRIVYLNAHLERLKASCAAIGIKLSLTLPQLKACMYKTVRLNGCDDSYVKLTLWHAPGQAGVLIFATHYKPYSSKKYKAGFYAGISSLRQDESSFFAKIKTTNRLLFQLSYAQAVERKLDEALILNNRGYVCEGSRTNLFFIKNKELCTPSLGCGCLDGITRTVVLDIAKKHAIRVYEGGFTPFDVYKADEAFLTNSLIRVMPLASIEDKSIGSGKCGRLTAVFIKEYTTLLTQKRRKGI